MINWKERKKPSPKQEAYCILFVILFCMVLWFIPFIYNKGDMYMLVIGLVIVIGVFVFLKPYEQV